MSTLSPAASASREATGPPPTVGVEEEFALLDPVSGEVALVAGEVIDACGDQHGIVPESMAYMVETRTPVCRTLDEVRHSLNAKRSRVATEARRCGATMVASGVAPYGVPDPPPVRRHPRYTPLLDAFPLAMSTTGTCGCHVHVAVPTPDVGVQVLLRLRRWLPALTVLSTNSPIWQGRDVGWASMRYVFSSRWPTARPAPPVATIADYDEFVRTAILAGLALDPRSIYLIARISPRHPTVEVRIADVFLTVEETVAYVGLVRALVGKAVADVARAGPVVDVAQDALVDACREAACGGLCGRVADPASGKLLGGWQLADALVAHVLPYLDRYRDTDRVLSTLYRLRVVGSGAERQRRMFAAARTAEEYVVALADATTGRLARGQPLRPERARLVPPRESAGRSSR